MASKHTARGRRERRLEEQEKRAQAQKVPPKAVSVVPKPATTKVVQSVRKVSLPSRDPAAKMPGHATFRHSNADLLYPSRIGEKREPLPVKGSGPFKSLIAPRAPVSSKTVAQGAPKSSAKIEQKGARVMARHGVDLKGDGGAMCRSVNRPPGNSGNGTSRDFVPWCSKGRK